MGSMGEWAEQFLNGPEYSWGSTGTGPVDGYRRAIEAGGTIEEIHARVWEWLSEDFRAHEQAFRAERVTHSGVNVC